MYLSTEHLAVPKYFEQNSDYRVDTLLEQGSSRVCEDCLLVKNNLFAVFDGATSLGKKVYQDGLTGGLLAARTAAESFDDSNHSLWQLSQKANQAIREMQLCSGIAMEERHCLWSTSMAAVKFEGEQVTFCQTGDAAILMTFNDGTFKVITAATDIDRETLALWKQAAGATEVDIYHLLEEQIKKVRLQMNRDYGVLNGEPEAMDFVQHGCENIHDLRDIILFTDGLYLPKEDPQKEGNWHQFLQLYHAGGIQAIWKTVRAIQQNDPRMEKFPRFKMHDDIAAISIKLV